MRVTLKSIAKVANVSAGTVSSVLNGKAEERGVPQRTAQNILKVAHELGYVPNYAARGLRNQHLQNIGLLIDESIQHGYVSEIINHIEQRLSDKKYFLSVGMLKKTPQDGEFIRQFAVNRCDAVIAVSVTLDDVKDDAFKALERAGIPVALVYSMQHQDYDCIFPDLEMSKQLARDYLAGQGRKRVLVAPEHGEAQGNYQGGREFWWTLRQRDPNCDGIVAMSDEFALGVIRGIRESGLRVPEDVMVVAQNNTEPIQISETPLVSTEYDLDLMAKWTVELIMSRLEANQHPDKPRRICHKALQPRLIVPSI